MVFEKVINRLIFFNCFLYIEAKGFFNENC